MKKAKGKSGGKTIVFTGGGSGGHVMLNLSLMPLFREAGWEIHYIGSRKGIEKEMTGELGYAEYHAISTGKLRRYFSIRNAIDAVKVAAGCAEAVTVLKRIRPDVIFSKGGYVSFPVVRGGAKLKVPVIAHESDYTPGLANRLAGRYADAICLTFRETRRYIKSGVETIYVGPVVRPDIYKGDRKRGLEYCGINGERPVIMVVGGSLGAERVNAAVRAELEQLLKRFQVVHICGSGNADSSIEKSGYIQLEYVNKEFADILAAADIVISRAGSNAIFEFLAVRKPMLLIPLSAGSRGDQVENAERFERKGYARVLKESESAGKIYSEAVRVYEDRKRYITAMEISEDIGDDVLKKLFSIISERALTNQRKG